MKLRVSWRESRARDADTDVTESDRVSFCIPRKVNRRRIGRETKRRRENRDSSRSPADEISVAGEREERGLLHK